MPNSSPKKNSTFYNSLDPQTQNSTSSYMNQRFSQLLQAWQESSRSVRRFLFLTNAGSAVAMVSFMGAAKQIRQDSWSWMLLGVFLLGIILLGILEGIEFHRVKGMALSYRKDMMGFMENTISFETLNKNDEAKSKPSVLPVILAWGSFACLIMGFIVGFCHFFQLKNIESKIHVQIQKKSLPPKSSPNIPYGKISITGIIFPPIP